MVNITAKHSDLVITKNNFFATDRMNMVTFSSQTPVGSFSTF